MKDDRMVVSLVYDDERECLTLSWPVDDTTIVQWIADTDYPGKFRVGEVRHHNLMQHDVHPDDITLDHLRSLKDRLRQNHIRLDVSPDVLKIIQHKKSKENHQKQAVEALNTLAQREQFPGLKLPLYPWQVNAVRFLEVATAQDSPEAPLQGAIECDQMGLGKTFIVNAHLALKGEKGIVICPAGIRLDWLKKTQMLRDASIFVVGEESPIGICEKADLIICSYAYLKKWGWYLCLIAKDQKRVVVLDEAHYIKNPAAIRTQMALGLAESSKYAIPMTGTPITNRAGDIYSLLVATRRLWSDLSYEGFVSRYENPTGHRILHSKLQGVMVRRLKEEVWDQDPGKHVGTFWLDISNREEYQAAEDNFLRWLSEQGANEDELDRAARGHALVRMNALRQIAVRGKLEHFTTQVQDALDSGEQVVVFCTFKKPLKALYQHFASYKGEKFCGAGLIIGDTPEKQRNIIKDQFQSGKLGVLFMSRSGSEGLDLTAAALEFSLDLPWTPAAFEQAADRIHRIGQNRRVQIIKSLAPETIDEHMENILLQKAKIAAETLGEEAAMDRVMSKPILQEVLREYFKKIPQMRKKQQKPKPLACA